MGLRSREKGKRFERAIANEFRARWPEAVVRRASQADRAHQSDVYVTGGPPVLARLWCECQDARVVTPIAKLKQAERDAWVMSALNRLPLAITHRLGERTTYVTTRLWVLDEIRVMPRDMSDAVVTMDLGEFLDVVEQHVEREAA